MRARIPASVTHPYVVYLPPAEHALKAMKATPSAEEVLSQGIEGYDALFIPGGGQARDAAFSLGSG